MAENESFFRKVVRFVANPATDWTDLNSRQEGDSRELEIEKTELKAMIERKRRNDFVRKREFDMLRRVRREGLSPEQLAALGGSSRLDDSEARLPDAQAPRPDSGVKAKIDEIEQQMVGDGFVSTRKATGLQTAPGGLRATPGASGTGRTRAPVNPPRLDAALPVGAGDEDGGLLPPLPPLNDSGRPPAAATSPVQMASGLPPLTPSAPVSFELPDSGLDAAGGSVAADTPARARRPPPAEPSTDNRATPGGHRAADATAVAADASEFGAPFAVEISEVVHDPELDEAVIAFANADFTQCEDSLRHLTGNSGPRAQHADTWLVLFDLYRATGQQQQFESLAVNYAQQFGWSAPQWYSLPKLVAEAQNDVPALSGAAPTRGHGDVGWVSPETLDLDEVARLRSQTLQMPLPWIFDWGPLRLIEPEAAMQLSTLFRLWSGQALEMRWIGGDRLFQVLQDSAPTGVRDADPAFWLTRLDALRLANRADQFDEAAIDYCVTYEVSPPSWETTRCRVHISGSGLSTRTPSMSMVSDVSTSFLESGLHEEGQAGVEVAHVELSGQLIGDIGATLDKLNGQLGQAPVVSVSCARLIRVDFIAAGDLLNWVLSKRNDQRSVQFFDTHRLVALFFGAMGINEHAKVQVRKV
jgi:hypothetical protein